MREYIQQLIAEGRTEEALALLVQHNSDAVPEMFNDELKQMHSELITISNRILTKLEA